MPPTLYTEDTLVQQTTAEYLEQQLGWLSVYAHTRPFLRLFMRD
jgi:type I restriction enzyme R subunit